MEVTKSNFHEVLPELEKEINSSCFLAIDGEFTGLSTSNNITSLDTPTQYYHKLKSSSLDFLFVQFGLSIFKRIEGSCYSNKTYSFYLFPIPLNRDAPDCRFLCQASSLGFLAKNGFDFNKLFREGIPYLKQTDADSLKQSLIDRQKYNEANSSVTIKIPPIHQPTVDAAIAKFKELLSPECTETEVKFESCPAFVRKLIYQTVQQELEGITVSTESGVLVARKGTENKEKKQESEIQSAIGFVNVIKAIVNSDKLVVGHNMLLDLCHVIQRFVDQLPDDYEGFKDMLHTLFPKVVDTKYMCSDNSLKDIIPSSILQNVFETLSKEPFLLPEIESDYYSVSSSTKHYHDAGYDAFITGVSFLTALAHLDNGYCGVEESPSLAQFLNKLFLMRTPDTYINLAGKDPVPPRNHVFHVTFPKSWTGQNLNELFSPFGSIQISWTSDTTAWVTLHDRSEAGRAKKALENRPINSKNCGGGQVVVKGYRRYLSKQGGGSNSIGASPRPNKRKSGGNGSSPTLKPSSPMTIYDPGSGDNKKKRKSSIDNLPAHRQERKMSPLPEEQETEMIEWKRGKKEGRINEEKEKSCDTTEFILNDDWS